MNAAQHEIDDALREGAEVLLISRQPVENMNAAQHEIDDALRTKLTVNKKLLKM
jgi:hypothetical protein